MNIVVNVTAEDIAKGVPGTFDRCPIALALMRATGASRVSVDEMLIDANEEKFTGYYEVPTVARDFMDLFDAGLRVGPITFTISKGDQG